MIDESCPPDGNLKDNGQGLCQRVRCKPVCKSRNERSQSSTTELLTDNSRIRMGSIAKP